MTVEYINIRGTGMELVAIVDDNDGVKVKNILGEKAKDRREIDSFGADAILITSMLEKERIFQALKRSKNKTKVFSIS
jgi:hypothetical protein